MRVRFVESLLDRLRQFRGLGPRLREVSLALVRVLIAVDGELVSELLRRDVVLVDLRPRFADLGVGLVSCLLELDLAVAVKPTVSPSIVPQHEPSGESTLCSCSANVSRNVS